MSLSRLSINSLTLFTVVLGLKCPILHHVREATSVSVVAQKPKPQGTQAHKRLLEAKFTNSLMIHKEKKTHIFVQEWVDLHQRFSSRSKNLQSCIISSRISRPCIEFLNLMINFCSLSKKYLKDLLGNLSWVWLNGKNVQKQPFNTYQAKSNSLR